jgi:chromate reductase
MATTGSGCLRLDLHHVQTDVFGEGGDVRDELSAEYLRRYMEEYCAFVQRVLAANAPAPGQTGGLERDADKLSR